MIMPSGDASEALALAQRLTDALDEVEFGPAGKITISVGVSQGPEHAMNPRELVACAEAAMMTAKARGKNQIVLFEEASSERPDGKPVSGRDVRSIAHLKMLQSLAGKLNRLNDVRQIGEVIADELRLLIDYHNCRVSVIEGDEVVPIAFRGELLSRSGERVDFPRTRIGEGITGHVAETSEPLLVKNTLECEFAVMIPGTHMIEESQIAVPLCYGARVIGVVAISKLGVDQFDEDDVRLLEVLAGQASVALENARLYEAQRREADHLKALLEFTGAISEAASPGAIGAETVLAAARILGGKRCALWLPDENGDFRISAHSDYDAEPGLRPMLRRRAAGRCDARHDRRPHGAIPARAAEATRCMQPPEGVIWPDLALAPLRNDGSLEGFISVREPTIDSEHSVEEILRLLGGISYQAAVALERARSYESLEETFVSTVEALANALEANDEYTSSHTRWITDMALRVGEAMGFEADELKRLELGALFHDIGKIGIPTSILLKPGPLSPEERAMIEMHPELGERILEPIERLAEVRTIVRSCHERWDGAGYPDRKAGEEIPLEARIILVCDAFHAMTTDRPYRKRLSCEEACRRLREGAGTQFDPNVVDVFLGLRARGAGGARRRRRAARLVASLERGKSLRARASDEGRAMRQLRLFVLVCALGAALAAAGSASASQLVARNASGIKLGVNAKGTALVTYSGPGQAHAPARLGRGQRAPAAGQPEDQAGRVQARLLRRLAPSPPDVEDLQERLRRLRRSRSPVAGDRLQGAERLVLGAAELADRAAGPRPRAVARPAEDLVAAPVALDGRPREARRLHGLDLRRPLPGGLRPVHLPGQGHPRLRHDQRRRADRRLRPAALPRHVQLVLRAGLAARELVRLARAARDVLLRLLRPQPVGRRLRPSRARRRTASAGPAPASSTGSRLPGPA